MALPVIFPPVLIPILGPPVARLGCCVQCLPRLARVLGESGARFEVADHLLRELDLAGIDVRRHLTEQTNRWDAIVQAVNRVLRPA